MFAKRHYESVALAMQRAHPQDHSKRLDQWHTVKRELAAMFKADSSRFDEARFVVACLPGHNVRARTQHLKTKAASDYHAARFLQAEALHDGGES